MRTTIQLEHEPAAAGHLVRVLLRLEGDPPPSASRPPLNLSLVLDRSGSMGGAKLVAARAAAALLVRRLALQDLVSVVAYDDQVTVVSPPTAGADASLPGRIAHIEAGGCTNLSGGWLRALEFVKAKLAQGSVNRVLLLTDGLANVGITDPDRLVSMCQAAKREGVTTTTVGFGEDYDERLLRAMADGGGGNMYYIEHPDQAPAIFADELEGLLGMAAQNLRVEVRVSPAVQLAAVHHEYPRTETPAGALLLELGDLYAREPKSVLCEFLAGDVAAAATVLVATLVVTADVMCEQGIEHRRIELPVSVSPAEGPKVDPEVQRELLLLEAARAKREALDAQAAGDYERGAATLQNMQFRLAASGLADEELLAEVTELHDAAAMYEAQAVSPADQKYLFQQAYNRASGRAAKAKLIRRPPRKDKDA